MVEILNEIVKDVVDKLDKYVHTCDSDVAIYTHLGTRTIDFLEQQKKISHEEYDQAQDKINELTRDFASKCSCVKTLHISPIRKSYTIPYKWEQIARETRKKAR